jgi:hypothetical protein
LAREFIRSGKTTAKLPVSAEPTATIPETSVPLDVAKLNTYERYGLTVVPLFLGLLTVIALGMAAHSSDSSTVYANEPAYEPVGRHRVGFTEPSQQTAGATARADQGKHPRHG